MKWQTARQRLNRVLVGIDSSIRGVTETLLGWGLMVAIAGVCLGSSALAAAHALRWTKSSSAATHLVWAASGITLLLLIGVAVSVARARRFSAQHVGKTLAGLARRLPAALSLPLLVSIGTLNERSHPFTTLALTLAAGIAVGATGYQLCKASGDPAPADVDGERGLPHRRWFAPVGLMALFGVYCVIMTKLSWSNLWGFNMGRSDMGYYVSIFRQSSLGNPLGMTLAASGNHLSGHFDPILVLLSPLYLIYPHAETILLLQVAWLGSGVFPLYALARHFGCGSVGGLLLALCYVVYPPLHGINLFDFHSLALAVPVVLWVLYFFESGRRRAFFIAFGCLLLVREDMALVSCFIGWYMLISGRQHGRRWGWVVIGSALLWLIVVKGFVMTRSDLLMAPDSTSAAVRGAAKAAKSSGGYAGFYADLIPAGGNTKDLVATLISDPVTVLGVLLKEEKIKYALLILSPLCFLPLLATGLRVTLLYGFAFTLLASRPYLHSIHFQYSSVLVPFVFATSAQVLGGLRMGHVARWLPLHRRGLVVALLSACVTSSVLCSWQFGAWIPNRTFRGGFRSLERNPTQTKRDRAAWLKTVCGKLPKDAVVATNSRMLAHLGDCTGIVLIQHRKRADYVVYLPSRGTTKRAIDRERRQGRLVEIEKFQNVTLYEIRHDVPGDKKKSKKKPKAQSTKKNTPRREKNQDGKSQNVARRPKPVAAAEPPRTSNSGSEARDVLEPPPPANGSQIDAGYDVQRPE